MQLRKKLLVLHTMVDNRNGSFQCSQLNEYMVYDGIIMCFKSVAEQLRDLIQIFFRVSHHGLLINERSHVIGALQSI